MKWIIITTPTFISHEAKYIDQLFEAGIDLLHLRKPDSTPEECEQLIQKIDPKWYPQIVIHDHFELCEKYHLHGIHLNRRNSQIPEKFQGSISRSCHSFEEVTESLDNANPRFSKGIEDNIRLRIPQSYLRQHFEERLQAYLLQQRFGRRRQQRHHQRKGDCPWRHHSSIHSPAARLELWRSSFPG